jgi:tryptophan synthase alpha chain
MATAGLSVIYLIAPTTPDDRIELIARRASGFIYYVSREGVTGMQKTVAQNIQGMVNQIKTHTKLPIAVGFGISNPAQARNVATQADAVVVGSAVVDQIARHGQDPLLVEKVMQFTKPLIDAVKS